MQAHMIKCLYSAYDASSVVCVEELVFQLLLQLQETSQES